MIRRDLPRGTSEPEHWVLITQQEHARLSGELARAWGSQAVPPLVCPADEPEHPLAGVRQELLAAIDHHDDGWADWDRDPGIDPKHNRPYAFTEMPPDIAQRIWSDSIEACRAIGPLAGWVAASHFSALQSKRDEDYPEWIEWLAGVDRRRADWLAAWLAASEHHTERLADRCLAWLQTLDWMSLWLCCRCPAFAGDEPGEPLAVGEDATGWPRVTFAIASPGAVRVGPWPFGETALTLRAACKSVATKKHADHAASTAESEPIEIAWTLLPDPVS